MPALAWLGRLRYQTGDRARKHELALLRLVNLYEGRPIHLVNISSELVPGSTVYKGDLACGGAPGNDACKPTCKLSAGSNIAAQLILFGWHCNSYACSEIPDVHATRQCKNIAKGGRQASPLHLPSGRSQLPAGQEAAVGENSEGGWHAVGARAASLMKTLTQHPGNAGAGQEK